MPFQKAYNNVLAKVCEMGNSKIMQIHAFLLEPVKSKQAFSVLKFSKNRAFLFLNWEALILNQTSSRNLKSKKMCEPPK